jgi:hypothetical protein
MSMENTDKFDLKKVSEKEHCLIAPCGIYCGACDIFLGRSRELAKELYRIMMGFNIADVGPGIFRIERQKLHDYLEILRVWGQGEKCCGCWKGVCWEGGGRAVCLVKACAERQGYLTCAECSKMPCYDYYGEDKSQTLEAAGWLSLVTKRYAQWNIDNLNRIREIGYRQFIDEMQEKVKCGFLTSDVISNEMLITKAGKKRKE